MADMDISSLTEIIKEIQTKKFGRYKGIVIDNADPEKRGRLKLQVADILGEETTDWVEGVFPLGGNSDETFVFVPAAKSVVTVEFLAGDISSPVWTGTYYAPDVTHSSALDESGEVLSLVRTRSGLEIRIRDDGEKHSIAIQTAAGAHFSVDEDGNLEMHDENGAGFSIKPGDNLVAVKGHGDGEVTIAGSKVSATDGSAKLEINGGNVTITAGSIKLDGDSVALGKGANAPLLNAAAFMQAYATHVHTPTPPGPATPPVPVTAVKLARVTGA